MSKSLKFVLFAVMVFVMTTGVAFAGTAKSASNGGGATNVITISLEALGAARNIPVMGDVSGGKNVTLGYTVSQVITSGNFVQVTFTGAAFAGNAVRVCKVDGAAAGNQIGLATPTEGQTSYNFQLAATNASGTIPSGESLYLTTDGGCNATGAGANLIVKFSAATTTTAPTASVAIVSAGNIPVDTASSANIASIVQEYAANYGSVNHTIDYLGTVGNGTLLLSAVAPTGPNAFAASNAAANVTRTLTGFGAVNGRQGNAGLTAGLVIYLADSQNWQGVSSVYIQGAAGTNSPAAFNGTCTSAAALVSATGTLNGTLALTVPTAAINGLRISQDFAVCVVSAGNVGLNTRTITAAANILFPNVAAGTASTFDTWNLNAYQAMIPYSHTNSTVPSYCVINNMGATNVSVIYDVLSSEASLQSLNNSLGTVNNKTTALVTISGSTVTMAGSNSTATLTALGTNSRHADRITVTGSPANINASCFQTDPITGGKRNVLTLH